MDRDDIIALTIALVLLVFYIALVTGLSAVVAYVVWVLVCHTNFFLVWAVTGLVLLVLGGFKLSIRVRI